jgi:hypothetical protein
LLKDYCGRMELPDNAAEFTNNLPIMLTAKAAAVDQKYAQNGELTVNSAGEPVLSRVTAKEIPESLLRCKPISRRKCQHGTCWTSLCRASGIGRN